MVDQRLVWPLVASAPMADDHLSDIHRKLAYFQAEVRKENLSFGDKAVVQSNLMIVEALADLRETVAMVLEAVLDVRDQVAKD